jgi:hypothetical protein
MTHPSAVRVTRRAALGWLAVSLGAPAGSLSACSRRPDVVVTGQVDAVRARAYRDLTVGAVAQVRALWGPDSVPTPVRLHLPRSAAQWSQATGQHRDDGLAASTVRRPGQEPRIVVHPQTWESLVARGRRSVVTHEVTHLAMGPSRAAPWWLVEGLAEYTAHRGFTGPPAQIAGSAWAPLLARPPSGWPAPGATTDPWQGYAAAWLACVFLVGEAGEQAVLDTYGATRAGTPFERACPALLGRSALQLHRAWLSWLESQDAALPG